LTADRSLQTVLEIVLELIWTRLPAALYAAGWSDEADRHGGFHQRSPCFFEMGDEKPPIGVAFFHHLNGENREP